MQQNARPRFVCKLQQKMLRWRTLALLAKALEMRAKLRP